MGVQINLKNVDFGESGFDLSKANLVVGGVNVRIGDPKFGDMTTNTNRLRFSEPVYIEEGQVVTFFGLTGKDVNDDDCTLLIDGVAYNSENTSHSTAVASLSNSDTDFYKLNAEKQSEFSWKNTIGSYWFVFTFGDTPSAATSTDVLPSGFDMFIERN